MRKLAALGLFTCLLACAAPPEVERNKAVVRRYFDEMWNQKRADLALVLLSPDYVHHPPVSADVHGNERIRALVGQLHGVFTDLKFTVEDMIAEGDRVFSRVTVSGVFTAPYGDIQPTNKPVAYKEFLIHRLRDGRIVEAWNLTNASQVLRPPAER